MSIPRRLIRTVPADTTREAEVNWALACSLHRGWEHVTLRDPVSPARFPLTSHLWVTCESGAQLADLIRLEELYHRGGVYIDSDVVCYRPFDPLLGTEGFAGWDNVEHIPNAILGFRPGHPALKACIDLAIERHDQGTWAAGVGVTTEVFRGRNDMVLLPPGSFYPVFWRHKDHTDWPSVPIDNPWAYCAHQAAHSWKDCAQ